MSYRSRVFAALISIWFGACSDDPAAQTPPLTQPPASGSPASAGTSAAPLAGATGSSGGAAGSVVTPPLAGRTASPATAAGMGGGSAGSAAAGSGGQSGAPAGAGGGDGTAGSAGASGSAGGAGSAGGMQPMAAGGFPKTDEVNIKAKGPYAVMTYTMGLDDPEYSSSMMYYPEGAQPPFGVVAFAPGWTAVKENYTFLGFMLASHGIAALLTTPSNTDVDQPPARGEDLVAAVARIQAENARSGSPLNGKIATDRICVTGQSMGGGGSLFAANELGDKIRCVMPLQPYQPSGRFSMITAPTMIIGAQSDTTASVASHSAPHYESIPDSTEKFLVVFQGDHFLSTNRTSTDNTAPEDATPSFDLQAAYMIPFYKLFLESDERYRPYLYGDQRSTMSVTRYEKSKM